MGDCWPYGHHNVTLILNLLFLILRLTRQRDVEEDPRPVYRRSGRILAHRRLQSRSELISQSIMTSAFKANMSCDLNRLHHCQGHGVSLLGLFVMWPVSEVSLTCDLIVVGHSVMWQYTESTRAVLSPSPSEYLLLNNRKWWQSSRLLG